MEYFSSLPEDITLHILSRVPTESVLDCKLVCTTWNNIVSHHPSFRRMHLNHLNHVASADSGKLGFLAFTYETGSIEKFHYFEYNENHESTTPIEKVARINLIPPFDTRINYATPFERISFHGSCNGLICFARSRCFVEQSHGPVYICNPITKEYVMLPEIKRDYCKYNCRMNAFGYVSSTNEYKVLGMYLLETYHIVEVHIYTLGSGNGWRNLGKFNYRFSPHHAEQAIFANGALYWMGLELGTIFTFDLSEEKFCENRSLPPLLEYHNYWIFNKMGVLDGFLFFAVLQLKEDEGPDCYDIWLLRKKNGNHHTKEQGEHQPWVWSKEFKVDDSELLAVTKSGGVFSYQSFTLNIYDTKASTSKILVQFEEKLRRIYLHRNSLVSLKELGEEDTKIMESVEDKITWDLSVNQWLSSLS